MRPSSSTLTLTSAAVLVVTASVMTGVAMGASSVPVWSGVTARVASSANHLPFGGWAINPDISANGKLVAFGSLADDLVPNDTNGANDVFVENLATGKIERVSVGSNGREGSGLSYGPALSANGRFVAFTSYAGDLVRGDTNHSTDIFVHDRQTGMTRRVSVRSDGTDVRGDSRLATISGDGQLVAFQSDGAKLVKHDTNEADDVFVHNSATGTTKRVSVSTDGDEGLYYSRTPHMSRDGRFVSFYSVSPNLTAHDTNGFDDIFVRNIERKTTHLVSLGNHEQQGKQPSDGSFMSADGRYVAFVSDAGNLVKGDTNHAFDVFVRDRKSKTTVRASVGQGGAEGNDNSFASGISADGRRVLFFSQSSNWLSGDTDTQDVFVRNIKNESTRWVSVGLGGELANASCYTGGISGSGDSVVFASEATNLVPDDTNGFADIFIRTR
jgi:Tol biopolymer transport system component